MACRSLINTDARIFGNLQPWRKLHHCKLYRSSFDPNFILLTTSTPINHKSANKRSYSERSIWALSGVRVKSFIDTTFICNNTSVRWLQMPCSIHHYRVHTGTIPRLLTKEIEPSLAKPPLKFNGSFVKRGLISLVNLATGNLNVCVLLFWIQMTHDLGSTSWHKHSEV